MQRAKDRQRDSETQIAQGHELFQAASLGDLILRRQYSDHEERDTGGAHCDLGAGDFEERGENGLAHRFPDLVDSFRWIVFTLAEAQSLDRPSPPDAPESSRRARLLRSTTARRRRRSAGRPRQRRKARPSSTGSTQKLPAGQPPPRP